MRFWVFYLYFSISYLIVFLVVVFYLYYFYLIGCLLLYEIIYLLN